MDTKAGEAGVGYLVVVQGAGERLELVRVVATAAEAEDRARAAARGRPGGPDRPGMAGVIGPVPLHIWWSD